jgi:N-carbamoyl-L-amino-acid hydrolase
MLIINEHRFRAHFEALTRAGATDGGLHRPTFSDAHLDARRDFRALVEDAGFDGRVDGAGNHSAFLACGVPGAKTLLFGSHLDSVPHGGRFDGALGVAAAFEALQTIRDAGVPLAINLEVIDFTDEEGSWVALMGSRALAGALRPNDLDNPRGRGKAFQEALTRAGLTTDGILAAARPPETLAGYLEIHIEQGTRLETAQTDVGIVTGLVGIWTYHVTFTGRADHAGTTSMHDRLDAAQGAAAFILAVRRVTMAAFPACVANVGKATVTPGAFNIVPETVTLHLELRGSETAVVEKLEAALAEEAARAAETFGLGVDFHFLEAVYPTPMDERMQRALEKGAGSLGLSHRRLPSLAGHDAQSLARICPAGMLFVPSAGGFSHSPREFTAWPDCVNGANTLLRAVLHVATHTG